VPGPVITRASSDTLATSNPTIARIVSYARDHLDDRLEVRHLAEKFRMSRQHLNLIFRQAGYCTPVEMLQHLAAVRAKHLLASTDLTIREVAAQCGYVHLAHFGVMFRNITGTTPAAYRHQWR
jgi:transcriptional regulator GlxA family with amidase domain